eukprot:g30061.t1
MSHGFAYFVGRDRALRPALVFRASRVPEQWRKDYDVDRLLRVLIFCMEVMLRFMLVPGFRFYVCNVPRMLMAISHVAKNLLTERQKLKVRVLSDVCELLEDFAPHQLELDLGGSRPLAKTFLPFPLGPGPFYPGSAPRLCGNKTAKKEPEICPSVFVACMLQCCMTCPEQEAREEVERHKAEASGLSPSSIDTRQDTISGRLTSNSRSPDSFEALSQPWAFREGDEVEVWSMSQHAWVPGVVQAVFAQNSIADGYQVPAGTLKISIPRGAVGPFKRC